MLSILIVLILGLLFWSSASSSNNISTLNDENKKLKSSVLNLQANIDSTPPIIEIAELYEGVNNERIKLGLGKLEINTRLEISACAKAYDMSAKNYWSHIAPGGTTPWEFIRSAGYNYLGTGENLARGHMTAMEILAGWVSSPTHYENIVGSFSDMGICIIQTNQPNIPVSNTAINIIVNHFGKR